MKHKKLTNLILTFGFAFCLLTLTAYGLYAEEGNPTSAELIDKAWAAHGKRDIEATFKYTQECIDLYKEQADKVNDVATAYFIQAESYMRQQKIPEAKKLFQLIIDKFPYAQAYDPRGWFWSIKEKAEITLKQLETGKIEEEEEEEVVITNVELYDAGTEFPVDYLKYGEFVGVGTKDYKYVVNDPIGLSKAVGEGIYPNTTSVKFDPEFVKVKRTLCNIEQWKILNRRDLKLAFYKWNLAAEPQGVKQFYIADILERSGLCKQAIKAYYAVLVHFPRDCGWTYWHTPWYIGQAALYRIKYLLREHPELDLKLEGASIKITNSFDNDIRNDIFIINPGRLAKDSFWKKIGFKKKLCEEEERNPGKIVDTKGGDRVKLVKYENGDWQFFVEGKPFMIKGITYAPTRIGESPDKGTLGGWTTQDLNKNGLVDGPYEAWVDKDKNNLQGEDENVIGDFQLMKEMGVNTLRIYHQPFDLNRDLLRQMHQKYGIYVTLGDFLGKYTLGSGADWEKGTDYDDPLQKENMLNSVKKMVLDFKDEPYVLVWLLGNENVYGLGCNADKKPESFFKFVNEAALLIKSLDPHKRPVAIASGDTLFLDIFAKNCPDIDIFGTNSYRGKYGFLDLWEGVKTVADKPAMITEYGAPSYGKGYTLEEAEAFQAEYHRVAWLDIQCNSFGYGAGNAIGGFVFEWMDEWWKAYEPSYHDRRGLFSGPFLDGYMHEEWLGLISQGNGEKSPFLRQPRKVYFIYKELWNNN